MSNTEPQKLKSSVSDSKSRIERPSTKVNSDQIPHELKKRDQYLCWTPKERGEKWTKPPRNPSTPGKEQGMNGYLNTDNLFSLEEANKAAEVCPDWGLGFTIHSKGNLTGFDLDDCRNPTTGEIDDWALKIVDRVGGYWEISPSGTGLHGYVLGTVSEDLTGNHDGLEVYTGDRYFTVTGNQLPSTEDHISKDVDTAEKVIEDWLDKYGKDESDTSNTPTKTLSEEDIPEVEVDDDVRVLRANHAILEYQFDNMTTTKAQRYTTNLLDGNYKELDITNDGHSDRSNGAKACFSFLYWCIQKYGDENSEPIPDAYSYLTKRCNDHKLTDDGRVRKWLVRDSNWREQIVDWTLRTYDPEKWDRNQRGTSQFDTPTGEYSYTTYEKVIEALETLIEKHERYPTSKEVSIFAEGLDSTRDSKSHRNALYKLRDRGDVKEAGFDNEDRIYYLPYMEDPPNANWVRIGGEESH